MSKRAIYSVTVNGTDITSTINPYLISISISDKAGSASDSASIELDDTGGQLILPAKGAKVVVMLGWADEGLSPVFEGTVGEVRSRGGRGGRTISVTARGIDTASKAKQPQQKHFDDKSLKEVLEEAGKEAGITDIRVADDLADIKRPYWEMRDESFIAFGQRIAKEVGGTFKVVDGRATMVKRNGGSFGFPAITAAWGVNLHTWDIAPFEGRSRFKKAKVRFYDRAEAKWKEREVETDIADTEAENTFSYSAADEDEAEAKANSEKAESEREGGSGSVEIEGNVSAQPEGECVLIGARPGIDGTYRIDGLTHNYSRSGFTTSLDLRQPTGEAGKDSRA